RLQGARKGLPPAASPATIRGGDADRPLTGWLPVGKGSHCLCKANSDTDGAREVRASF
ncbi:hypothetical protein B296_00009369, partial [Ensete ventricosum]